MKAGQTVIVTATDGQQTEGKISSLSASTLIVAAKEPRTFLEKDVRTIRRSNSLKDGMLIGAGIGGGIAALGFASSQGGSDSVYYWAAIGAWALPLSGLAVGALIDSKMGPDLVYRSPGEASLSPVLRGPRIGASLSVRY